MREKKEAVAATGEHCRNVSKRTQGSTCRMLLLLLLLLPHCKSIVLFQKPDTVTPCKAMQLSPLLNPLSAPLKAAAATPPAVLDQAAALCLFLPPPHLLAMCERGNSLEAH